MVTMQLLLEKIGGNMWLIDQLSTTMFRWGIYSVFIIGGIAYILSFFSAIIPPLVLYKTPLHFISLILLALGVYMYGCNDTTTYWRQKVIDANAEHTKALNTAKIELKKATDDIVIEQQKTQAAIDTQHVIIKNRILTITERIDSICTVDQSAIQLLNDASLFPSKEVK